MGTNLKGWLALLFEDKWINRRRVEIFTLFMKINNYLEFVSIYTFELM